MTKRVSRIWRIRENQSWRERERRLVSIRDLTRRDSTKGQKGRRYATRGKYAKQEAVCQVRAIFTSLIGHFPRSRDSPRDSARPGQGSGPFQPGHCAGRIYRADCRIGHAGAEPACLRLRCNTLRIHNAPRVRVQRACVETRVPRKSRSSDTYTGCVSPCRSGGVACGMGDGMAERIDRRSRFANESAPALFDPLSLFLKKKLELGNCDAPRFHV